MSFLTPPPPPGFRPPPGMATREASGSRMPPEGISYFYRVVKDSELNTTIHSYHPQVPEMGSNAKKKIRRKTQGRIC